MGFAYAGETGLIAGFSWAALVNYQLARPWFRKPWLHAVGMTVGYTLAKAAAAWEDEALRTIITQYERKGYQIPEDRRELFIPATAKQ
jgi:hypothetical protein